MRIKYFYAENMAGIKVGSKIDKIEIDFNKNKNNVILLLGGNGCGKTSLMSVLHPLRNTNDNRSVTFDGEKAYKEIHIENGKNLYVIKHNWKPNKSYIEKNGEELNPNGNIRSFNEIIKKELGLDEEYFKIGRLGSNVNNFIQLQSAERKKYIGNFLPNIDDYLHLFKIVNDKFSLMKKEIKNIGNQLDKFPEIETLRDKVNSVVNNLEEINKQVTSLEKEKAVSEFNYNEILKKLNEEGLNINTYNLQLSIKEYNSNLQNFNNTLDKIYNSFKELENLSLEEVLDKIKLNKNKYNELHIEYTKINSEYNFVLQQYSDLQKEINSYKVKLERHICENPDDIKDDLAEKKQEIKDIDDFLNNSNIDEYYLEMSIKEISSLKNKLSLYCNNLINGLISKYNYNSYDKKDYKDVEKLTYYKERIEELESNLEQLKSIISYTERNKKILDILEKRSSNCKDDTCSLIKNAVDFKKEYADKYEDNLKKLENYQEELISLKKRYEYIAEIKEFLDTADKYRVDFNNLDYFEPINNLQEFIDDMVKRTLEEIQNDFDLTKEYNVLLKKQDRKVAEEQLKLIEQRWKIYEDSNKNFNEIKEEVKKKESLLNDLYNKVNEKQQEKIKSEKSLKGKEKAISILENLANTLESVSNVLNSIKEKEDLMNKSSEMKNKITTLQNEISGYEDKISSLSLVKKNLTKEKEKEEKDLNYLEILLDNKEKLDNDFNNTKLIKDSLDPKMGIPLIFIEKFLESITDKTNELLNLAYEGSFNIKFELTDKDFFIQVYKPFSMLQDITMSSQGETSMTTLSLSLAMIQEIIKDNYNIVYLDEIDSTLSTHNRRIFLNMLEKQMNDLNIEQTFVISHNNEFYSYPVDLILFDGAEIDKEDAEFMKNKNIIFDVEKYREEIKE